ncbi:MAG: PAS domain-containing protein [Nitrospirae bacterium]|nr:PAS domain-containing protein [Nitrospirota bacterium]
MDTKPSHNRFSYYAGLILSFAGISSIILGLVVLYGWHTGNDTIVRIDPSFPVMSYNTAFFFILCGAGLLGMTLGWMLFSTVTVSMVLIISLVTIAEYITGNDLIIDKLFIHPSLHEKIQYPGRMPPNTALNFLLTVVSIYVLSLIRRQKAFRVSHFITGILGSLINTFACITIFGYITGLTGIYNWGYFSGMGMTLMASAGFLMLGSGIVVSAWNDGWTEKAGTPKWLPHAIVICLLTVTLNIWMALNSEYGIDLYHPLDDVIMLLGVFASLLLAVVVYFYQRLKINSKNVEDTNTHLRVEIEVRKQTEQHLKKAQQIGRMGSWEWNIVTNNLSWSENIFHIFGLAFSEFGATYEAFLNSVHPADRDFVIKSVNEALYENKPYSIDHRIVHPDGTLRVVHEQGEVTFDDNKPVMMLGTVQDVTEEWLLREDIRKSEEQYRTLFEESKDGIFTTSISGEISDANPAFVELIGYSSKDEVIRLCTVKDLYNNPEDRNKFITEIKKHGFINDFEVTIKRRDGKLIQVLATANSIVDKNGCILGFRGIVHDMTEYNMLEQQLIQSQKMEAVGQLTGGIAHDFNNMLTAMVGYMSLLKLKLSDNMPLTGYVDKVLTITDKASELIQSLMIFSRKQEVSYSLLELNKFINESSNLISKLVKEDIEFKVIPAGEELIISANSGQILQVLMNLVKNSVDAIHSKGAISISVETILLNNDFMKSYGYGKAGKYACISVTDNGIGITEDSRNKIFEPFFTTKDVGKGTGLGLAVVYGIIKGHNAYIDVTSMEGKCTTFKIYFPVIEQPYIKTEQLAKLLPVKGNETILIAEDDEDIQEVMKSVLEESGYKIIIAIDGHDAVNKLRENRNAINLIILDVIMPKKNGGEVYKEIREISPQIKTIFISGYTKDIFENRENRQFPEKDYVLMEKPVKPLELARKVKEVLGG